MRRYFPVGGMKHSQDDPRRSLRPPDGGRDDLLGEVMRKKRHRPDLSGSKQELSRLAGSGGSVLRIGITYLRTKAALTRRKAKP